MNPRKPCALFLLLFALLADAQTNQAREAQVLGDPGDLDAACARELRDGHAYCAQVRARFLNLCMRNNQSPACRIRPDAPAAAQPDPACAQGEQRVTAQCMAESLPFYRQCLDKELAAACLQQKADRRRPGKPE